MSKRKVKPAKEIEEIENLIKAYESAQKLKLTENNMLECHKLLSEELNEQEVFYHASLIHLKFIHIHPFMDGNGRTARLIEKWFIAEKSGRDFWKIPSEEYYKNHQNEYYDTINLGVNSYELNYDKCIDFLKLLPNCLIR